jgi:hypothetical protein
MTHFIDETTGQGDCFGSRGSPVRVRPPRVSEITQENADFRPPKMGDFTSPDVLASPHGKSQKAGEKWGIPCEHFCEGECRFPGLKFYKPPPLRSAVYFLSQRGRVRYVGSTKHLGARIAAHMKAGRVFDDVGYIEVPEHKRLRIEAFFIDKLRPPENRTRIVSTMSPEQIRPFVEEVSP